MNDRPVAETCVWQHTSIPPAGLDPAMPASERPTTQALDRTCPLVSAVDCRYYRHMLLSGWFPGRKNVPYPAATLAYGLSDTLACRSIDLRFVCRFVLALTRDGERRIAQTQAGPASDRSLECSGVWRVPQAGADMSPLLLTPLVRIMTDVTGPALNRPQTPNLLLEFHSCRT